MPRAVQRLHDGGDRLVDRLQAFELLLVERVGGLLVLSRSSAIACTHAGLSDTSASL